MPWRPFSWMKQLLVGSVEYREDFTNNDRKALYNVKRFENPPLLRATEVVLFLDLAFWSIQRFSA